MGVPAGQLQYHIMGEWECLHNRKELFPIDQKLGKYQIYRWKDNV